MLSFKEFINETVNIKDQKIIFDYLNQLEGQSTLLGKGNFKPYITTINKRKIFSIFKKSKNINNFTEIIKTIKKQTRHEMTTFDYDYFIRRCAIYLASSTSNIMNNVDIVLTPKSSSFIINDLIDELQKIKPNIKYIKESFYKLPVELIKIDYKNYNVSDKTKINLEKIINDSKNTGYIELKKVPKMFLNYITNILGIENLKIKSHYIENKNVLLIDDVISSGKTFEEMINLIECFSPKNIIGVTLYKT